MNNFQLLITLLTIGHTVRVTHSQPAKMGCNDEIRAERKDEVRAVNYYYFLPASGLGVWTFVFRFGGGSLSEEHWRGNGVGELFNLGSAGAKGVG